MDEEAVRQRCLEEAQLTDDLRWAPPAEPPSAMVAQAELVRWFEERRFCPYTGRVQVLIETIGGQKDVAVIGRDCFTRFTGQIVRYREGRAHCVSHLSDTANWRDTVDLLPSSGIPVIDDLAAFPDYLPAERGLGRPQTARLIVKGMGKVVDVIARHGRLYVLAKGGADGTIKCHTPYDPQVAVCGFQPPPVPGVVESYSILRCSETLLYANLKDGLRGWLTGTGHHEFTLPWPQDESPVLARIGGDRVLLYHDLQPSDRIDLYDLRDVLVGHYEPRSFDLQPDAVPALATVWAEACGRRFVVMDRGGRIYVVVEGSEGRLEDAELHLRYRNEHGWRLTKPSLARVTVAGGEVQDCAFAYADAGDQGRFLVRVPLRGDRVAEELPVAKGNYPSQSVAPCVVNGRLVNVRWSDAKESCEVGFSPIDRPDDVTMGPAIWTTQAPDVTAIQRLVLREPDYGRLAEYVHISYVPGGHGSQEQWFMNAEGIQVTPTEPFAAVNASGYAPLLWDLNGLYLCDVRTGEWQIRPAELRAP